MLARVTAIPEPVRQLALHPFRVLPAGPSVHRIDCGGAQISINPWPSAQIVEPLGGGPDDVPAAVAAARETASAHGKTTVAWWVAPEHDRLAPELEKLGLVNEDTPGFEAIENTMALVSQPAGAPVEDVEVRIAESFDDFRAGGEVARTVFNLTSVTDEDFRARYDEYARPSNPGRQFIATVEGRVVAAAYAALGEAGVNLFGGAVLPEARSRGVYRALTQARWEFAVERGTPALTVQAGRMSKPICDRLGFVDVAPVRLYVDDLTR